MRLLTFCLVLTLSCLGTSISLAQCDQEVEILTSKSNEKGIIEIRLKNYANYTCTLFAYEQGTKNEIGQKSGTSRAIKFSDLEIDRFYAVEFSFNEQKELLCTKWVSELIQIKE